LFSNQFVTSRNIAKYLPFFEVLLDQKIISNAVFSSDVWWQQWKNNCLVSTNCLVQKTIGKKNIFPIFWFQEMSLKRKIFVNFLPQKFMTKYGIVSTYSVTLCFRKFWHVSSVTCATIFMEWVIYITGYTKKILFQWYNSPGTGSFNDRLGVYCHIFFSYGKPWDIIEILLNVYS